ncbi:MAG: hypothetical protein JST35_02295 [Armatimonadetes bacterium]|nr:hypothetical protein [Armatimonadota bacterium]
MRVYSSDPTFPNPPESAYWEIVLTGADVVEWLQGQCTQDMRHLSKERPRNLLDGSYGAVYTFMCSPTGQIRAVLYCWRRYGTEVGIVADEKSAQHLLKTVEEAVIMEDVQAQVASRSAILGPTRGECDIEYLEGYLWHQYGATERAPEHDYPLQCYLFDHRLPVLGIDITETSLPAELGESVMQRYVSLNKGCYVGQEVIMRQHSRGRVNWNWAKATFSLDLKDATFDFGPKAKVQRVMIYHNRVEIGARVHTDVIENDFEVGGATFRFEKI